MALMPRGGMSNEATHCDHFSSIGCYKQLSVTGGEYLLVDIGENTATIKIPASLSALVIVLGDKSANIQTAASTDLTLDSNGVAWN